MMDSCKIGIVSLEFGFSFTNNNIPFTIFVYHQSYLKVCNTHSEEGNVQCTFPLFSYLKLERLERLRTFDETTPPRITSGQVPRLLASKTGGSCSYLKYVADTTCFR